MSPLARHPFRSGDGPDNDKNNIDITEEKTTWP